MDTIEVSKKMTFNTWIKQFESWKNIAELAQDIADDSTFPVGDYETIKNHLDKMGASDRFVEAFESAWAKFKEYEPRVAAHCIKHGAVEPAWDGLCPVCGSAITVDAKPEVGL
jgi:uncharacterized protein YozE (UPF0346 family)